MPTRCRPDPRPIDAPARETLLTALVSVEQEQRQIMTRQSALLIGSPTLPQSLVPAQAPVACHAQRWHGQC